MAIQVLVPLPRKSPMAFAVGLFQLHPPVWVDEILHFAIRQNISPKAYAFDFTVRQHDFTKFVADSVAKAERKRKTLATKSLRPCQIKDHTFRCGLLFGYVLANGKNAISSCTTSVDEQK